MKNKDTQKTHSLINKYIFRSLTFKHCQPSQNKLFTFRFKTKNKYLVANIKKHSEKVFKNKGYKN